MGERNSSLTRVQPVFNALLNGWPDGEPWVGGLWELAALTRSGLALPKPQNLGLLLASETPAGDAARLGKVYERTVAPPLAFLRWLLENPDRMQVRDRVSYGAKSAEAIAWRTKLFSGESELVRAAQSEAFRRLDDRLAQRGRQKWWAFEGFTHVDCCLMTDRCVLFVEGMRTELLSASTRWFDERCQLWRNVEAARELAAGREFGVILAVETDNDGQAALQEAGHSLAQSYPHLPPEAQAELNRHFLGFVTWADIVTRFGLPPNCVI